MTRPPKPVWHYVLARLLAVFLCVGGLCGCARSDPPPPAAADVLAAMQAAMQRTAQPLPDGRIYTRAAPPDSPGYLTEVFFSALYGSAAGSLLVAEGGGAAPVSDVALYLSLSDYPCELAVLRCSDTRSAATAAGLCRARLDAVVEGHRGGEWEALAAGGRVSVEGCFVFLVIAEDPSAPLAAARRAAG